MKTGNSYFGLARQASHSHYEQVLIARVMRMRGHAIDGALSKAFRRAA